MIYKQLILNIISLIVFILPIYIPMILSAQDTEDESSLHVGGALRYNVILQSYESDINATSSSFTMDT